MSSSAYSRGFKPTLRPSTRASRAPSSISSRPKRSICGPRSCFIPLRRRIARTRATISIGNRIPAIAATRAATHLFICGHRAEAEALAVVDSFLDRRVVGLLTEAYVLRRYAAALERRRRDMFGEE